MSFNQEPAKVQDRPYKELSPESKDRVLSELTRWLEEGFCQPKMEPSLLGLDWSLFATREFPEYADQTSFENPPEFISYAFSALDAYATAILAAHFSYRSLGVLNFTSSLKRRGPESQMHLEFTTIPERGRINPDSVIIVSKVVTVQGHRSRRRPFSGGRRMWDGVRIPGPHDVQGIAVPPRSP
jgi:hypothetical protein